MKRDVTLFRLIILTVSRPRKRPSLEVSIRSVSVSGKARVALNINKSAAYRNSIDCGKIAFILK